MSGQRLPPQRRPFGVEGGGVHDASESGKMRDSQLEVERRFERLMRGGTRALRVAQEEQEGDSTWDRVLTRTWEEPPSEARPSRLTGIRKQLRDLQSRIKVAVKDARAAEAETARLADELQDRHTAVEGDADRPREQRRVACEPGVRLLVRELIHGASRETAP